ncbi:MAG TPA: 50S ribosomal protein L1 [Candidatus Saccharimonadales bacterium]|nr:50S ribosomal protein L1 [Candidatus Saccharimonadales bacterium]
MVTKKTTEKKPKVEEKKETAVQETDKKANGEKVASDKDATAKAGKRSPKAIKEAAEKEAKEANKKLEKVEPPEPKPKKVRSKLERRSKKYRQVYSQIDKQKIYKLDEALDLAVKTSTTKFDSSVEIHVRLKLDPRQADQNIRDTVLLPAGSGKQVKIAVFADVSQKDQLKKLGADIVGEDEIIKSIDKNQIDFDVLLTTPNLMPKLGKYAKVLGPRGLMPNPKSGSITTDLGKAIKELKLGKIEYRVDSTGIIHLNIGKVSFGAAKLVENATAILTSIRSNKPSSVKGIYVRSIYTTTSMGPSIAIETSSL